VSDSLQQFGNFNLGDRVKIRHSLGRKGRIVELRGPLGPGGAQVYRVLIQRKPKKYIEVLEDQLVLLRAATPKAAPDEAAPAPQPS
jgi:hypothetical protein